MTFSVRSLVLAFALSLSFPAQLFAQPVSETVNAIMARENARGPLPPGPRVKEEKLAAYRATLPQNPDSPVTSQFTGAETNSLSSGAASAAPQTAGTSFLAIQVSEAPYVPPDTQMAVGPTQIIAIANGRIKVFDRNGVLGPLNVDTDTFFASVTGNSTTDPRVRFDRLSGRWFVIVIDIPRSKKNNKVLIAVSDGNTILGSSSFTFHSFQQNNAPPSGDSGLFADYPTLGIDRHALYIGCNMFSATFFSGTSGFVINKSNLLTGTLTVTAFRGLASGAGAGPYTPQGVDNDNPNSTEGYFIGIDSSAKGRLVVRRVSTPGGTPTISENLNITVPATTSPLGSVPNLGGGGLDDVDDRLFAATLKNGSLWTAHNIQVNASGVADSAGGRNGSRWYEITNLTGTPTLRQSGTVFDSAASNPASYWIPSCAMSGQGHVALGCSVAGNNQHAEIAVAGRLATDPLGTMSLPTVAQTSASTYNVSAVPQRWGDYSVVVVDPLDDMTLWTGQEYCNANNSWGTRVIQLKAPPPALPTNCSPATVPAGTNVNLLITGLSSSGSGFYDPGLAFPKHIGANVSGAGVVVNSTTYIDPTHISLNVSVLAGATGGTRSISITNPDGQLITSAVGLLTITDGPSATNHFPLLTAMSNRIVSEGALLTFTAVASDPDGNALTFALDNAPSGATINSTNGLFTWTPTEAQGPATNVISVRVTDDGSPSLSATQTFSVMVTEVNVAPTLAPIGLQQIDELTTLFLTNSASDTDLPANVLTFSLLQSPAGMILNTNTGVITWTPTEAQGPSANTVSVQVIDSGSPSLSATQTFTVMVHEVNSAPLLAAISNRVVYAGETVSFAGIATDDDLPANTLNFTLEPGAPAGANITTAGFFSWTTTNTGLGSYPMRVRVTDDGVPPASNVTSFSVEVAPPPTFLSATQDGTNVVLRWLALAGRDYQLQYKSVFDLAAWNDWTGVTTAISNTVERSDSVTNEQRFYRIRVLP